MGQVEISWDEQNELLFSSGHWKLDAEQIEIIEKKDGILFANRSSGIVELQYNMPLHIGHVGKGFLRVSIDGEIERGSGACFYINAYPCPLAATIRMEITAPTQLAFSVRLSAESSAMIRGITMNVSETDTELTVECSRESEILVVVPDYPSSADLSPCVSAHIRNRLYMENGLKVQVAAVDEKNWYQTNCTIDGIPVLKGNYENLKTLLERKQYKVVVTHFVDQHLLSVYDGYAMDRQMVFICHGPETTYRILENAARPYFVKEHPDYSYDHAYDRMDQWVRRYARLENACWIFVSDWLKETSERLLGTTFRNCAVIHNTIDARSFPYQEKKAEDRTKILVIRKFDNCAHHSIDQIALAIRELSIKPFFKELSFEIYGDGNYYETLTAPLHEYKNVHLHRTFIPNHEIHRLHAENGIMLLPSRHDAHPVSMCEAASSGMVVVGSRVTSNAYFMDEEHNHTLADPESPGELADIIERLYRNPEEFLAISRRMTERIHSICSSEQTIEREIALLHERLRTPVPKPWERYSLASSEAPVLTIVVPAYNVEVYLGKCLDSLLNHRNAGKTEILVINDGSTDQTAEIGNEYERLSNGIVRIINKENGGHGSTINRGIQEARGIYFRLIDGDDWVNSEALEELVDRLETETSDLVLTGASYAYKNKADYELVASYDMMHPGLAYHFEDLVYEGYGFQRHGPILSTSNYRTEILRRAGFRISEKKPYVDMEFNAFSLRYVRTVTHYPLDIYRYLIGRAGQTVSVDFWKKKYKDHRYVLMNIVKNTADNGFSKAKLRYINEHIVAQMTDSQVFMYGQLGLWEELKDFLRELQQYPNAYRAGMKLIRETNGDSLWILSQLKNRNAGKDNKLRNIVSSAVRRIRNR